jgi:probable HAF family extracellular repeat protein
MGQVVGRIVVTYSHAALWENGQLADLTGLLDGADSSSYARDVNGAGQIVGSIGSWAYVLQGDVTAVVGSFGGNSINNDGDIVGVSSNSGGQPRAFLWANGTVSELSSPDRPRRIATLAVRPSADEAANQVRARSDFGWVPGPGAPGPDSSFPGAGSAPTAGI